MIVVTSETIANKKIVKTLGLVRGNSVRARHVGKDIMAGLRNIVGGEIHEYAKLVAESREQAIDRMVAEGRPTTNALVLAASVAAFVVPDLLDESIRPAEASDMVDEVLQPLVKEIGIARRDAERTNQILLAQRRLIPSKKRRTKPMAFVKRDYFDEALTIYELLAAARGEVASELSFWRKLQIEGGAEPNAQTQRKRRRGGRRRRRQ